MMDTEIDRSLLLEAVADAQAGPLRDAHVRDVLPVPENLPSILARQAPGSSGGGSPGPGKCP